MLQALQQSLYQLQLAASASEPLSAAASYLEPAITGTANLDGGYGE